MYLFAAVVGTIHLSPFANPAFFRTHVTSSSGTPKSLPPRSFVTICTSTRPSPSLSRLCVFTTPKSSPQEYLLLYLPNPCPKNYPIPELRLAISLLVPQSLRLRSAKKSISNIFNSIPDAHSNGLDVEQVLFKIFPPQPTILGSSSTEDPL